MDGAPFGARAAAGAAAEIPSRIGGDEPVLGIVLGWASGPREAHRGCA
jgi:hypothetical protein